MSAAIGSVSDRNFTPLALSPSSISISPRRLPRRRFSSFQTTSVSPFLRDLRHRERAGRDAPRKKFTSWKMRAHRARLASPSRCSLSSSMGEHQAYPYFMAALSQRFALEDVLVSSVGCHPL